MSQTESKKYIQTRIQNKHALEVDWNSSEFIPLQGELIIYDVDANHSYERFKIGDGIKKVTELPFLVSNETDVVLKDDLYTYTNIGKITGASNTVPVKVASAGENLKTVFNTVFGTQQDQDPTINTSDVKLKVSTGTTVYGNSTTEYGTAIAATDVTITFTLANSGTAQYGYRCGNTKTTGSNARFKYAINKQTIEIKGQRIDADIKITLPTTIKNEEDVTISSTAYKQLTTTYNDETVTILVAASIYRAYSGTALYCNLNSSDKASITVKLPASSVTTSSQTRYGQIKGEVTLGNAVTTNGTAITSFLTFLEADPDNSTAAGQAAIAALSGGPKSNTAGAYTISAGKYYNYCLASTSYSLSSDTANPVTGATQFSSTSVTIPCSSASHIWFLLPPDTSGSKTIQYEPFANTWVGAFGGETDVTVGPVDVALKLASSTENNAVVVTYKGYYTSAKAAAYSSLKYKIV